MKLEKPGWVCSRSELDLFVSPKEQDPIVGFQDISYAPVNSIENDGPLIFRIPSNEQYFTDLAQTFLIATVKVTQADGIMPIKLIKKRQNSPNGPLDTSSSASIPDVPEVTVVNDFFDCQFSRVNLDINGVRVGSQHSLHPQVAVVRILASYSKEVASVNLKHSIGWFVSLL